MATTAKKPKSKASAKSPLVVQETDQELLKRSLRFADFTKFTKGATDDQLWVAINEAWRKPLVHGPRAYTIATNHKVWGTAIWFSTLSQAGTPNYFANGNVCDDIEDDDNLLRAVRDLFHIDFVEGSNDETKSPNRETPRDGEPVSDSSAFQTLKTRGKSRAKVAANEPASAAALMRGIEVVEECDILVSAIVPSEDNPRTEFDSGLIDQMAPNIVTICQLTPITVRESSGGKTGKHELIDGETRWRSAQVAQVKAIRAKVIRCTDAQAACLRLLSAVQRRDLNPIERAQGLKALLEKHQIPQRQLAEMVKLEQGSISNITRLLELTGYWQQCVISGEISQRAVRILLPWTDEPQILAAAEKNWKETDEDYRSADTLDECLGDALHELTAEVPKKLKLTDQQRSELRIRKFKLWGRDREACMNVKLLREIEEAAEKKRATAEQKRRDKADSPGKSTATTTMDPKQVAENARKQEQIHAKRLYRFKIAWYQAMIVADLDMASTNELIGLLLFLSTSNGNPDRASALHEYITPSSDTTKLNYHYGVPRVALLGGIMATAKGRPAQIESVLQKVVTQQLNSKFDGYHNVFDPEEYELLARHFDIDMRRDWTVSFDSGHPCNDLWDDFCKIWSREQILGLLTELRIKNTLGPNAKRSDLVELLNSSTCPKELLNAEPVRLT